MHGAGVVADEQPRALQAGVGGEQVDTAGEVDDFGDRHPGFDRLGDALVGRAADQHQPSAGERPGVAQKGAADLGEALGRPGLADPVGGRGNGEDRGRAGGEGGGARLGLAAGEQEGRRRIIFQPEQARGLDHLVDGRGARMVDGALAPAQEAGEGRAAQIDDEAPPPGPGAPPQIQPV